MNQFILMGRLTNDVTLEVKKETKIVRFTLAVKDCKETDFIQMVCFNKVAENMHNYVKKGHRILVNGKIKNNNYTNSAGQKVYQLNFIVNNFDFADSKGV